MSNLKRMACVLAVAAALIIPYELATATASTVWQPKSDASISWVWQLQGTPSLAGNAQMYDIDGFDNSAETVAAIHAQGGIAVCYIDLGTWEDWRADQASFPSSVLGGSNGWPGEKWLDIRQISALAPVMTARMQMCVQKGFDALEPDNIDGYSNDTGFPLTAQDQLAYNQWIANTAHSLGLSVGLKNDVDQAAQLEPSFDWALNEECNQFSECDALSAFTAANKAVFNAEYGGGTSFCAADIAAHINGAVFDQNLDGKTDIPCGGWTSSAAPAAAAAVATLAPALTTTPTTPTAAPNVNNTTTLTTDTAPDTEADTETTAAADEQTSDAIDASDTPRRFASNSNSNSRSRRGSNNNDSFRRRRR